MNLTLKRKKIASLSSSSNGISIGKLHFLENPYHTEITKVFISENKINKEISHFRKAILKTELKILRFQSQLIKKLTTQENQIFDALILILKDTTILSTTEKNIKKEKTNAAYTYFFAMEEVINKLSKSKSLYFQNRKQDLEDIRSRVLHNLNKINKAQKQYSSPTILVFKNVFSSSLSSLQNSLVKGIVVENNIQNSHFSILTHSLKIPTLSDLNTRKLLIYEGCQAILDSHYGTLIINPSPKDLKFYHSIIHQLSSQKTFYDLPKKPTITKDNISIRIDANMELHQEINTIINQGFTSVGLYRSEYLALSQNKIPNEDEQFRIYKDLGEKLKGDLTIRVFDSDYDKNIPDFPSLANDMNPSMGWRSTRFSLHHPILKTQLRAILKASGIHFNIKILFPFITSSSEFLELKTLTQTLAQQLKEQNIAVNPNLKIGTMIEVPSAALSIEDFVPHTDFVHIGTNDLIQFTQAIDRSNKKINHLYNPHHSSVLRLIATVSKVCHQNNIPLCLCGEMATNPLSMLILLSLGIQYFSITIHNHLQIKKLIHMLSYQELQSFRSKIFKFKNSTELENFFKEHFQQQLNFVHS